MESTNGSRGRACISCLFNANEIGVLIPEPHPDRALRIFLDVASPTGQTAIAPRIVQMPKAVLFLQAVEGEPASGAIYIYDRDSGEFYMVCFDGDDANLTVAEYDTLVLEYGLLEYAAQPELLRLTAQTTGQA